ncbi:cell wall-binding repeat-containing protein [Schaalia sp. 19OD2882]|uniref:cell wall-binding repeat-containing protein n=1 Tax=Schaalia sp. 19OD2882 TaxID=2794089 RepID=UPI001C1F0D3F|nr:cell wall-binding repeat-containing protein [Schaalia sp. 19OD2882]QWW19109.1 cell wall-binding repeat-containing protein [Schaalia sp. 19OD2882]
MRILATTLMSAALLVASTGVALAQPTPDVPAPPPVTSQESGQSDSAESDAPPSDGPTSGQGAPSGDTIPQSAVQRSAEALPPVPDISVGSQDPNRQPRSLWASGGEGVHRLDSGDPARTRTDSMLSVFPGGAQRVVVASTQVPGAAAEAASLAANLKAAFVGVGASLTAEETRLLGSLRPHKVLTVDVEGALATAVGNAAGRAPVVPLTQAQILLVQPSLSGIVTINSDAADQATAVSLAARTGSVVLARPLAQDTRAVLAQRSTTRLLAVGASGAVEADVRQALPNVPVTDVRGGDRAATALAAMRVGWNGKVPSAMVVPVLPAVDDLSAGVVAALDAQPLLRAQPTCLDGDTWEALRRADVSRRTVWGTTGQARAEAAHARCGSVANLPTARLHGKDAFATAVALSAAFHKGPADTVVLVGRGGVADGVAAGPLAARLGGPILLTARDALPASTRVEIQRLAPRRIVIVGGEGVVSAAVAAEAGRLAPVRRYGGATRVETSAAIAASFGHSRTVLVAGALGLPDALPGSAMAIGSDAPVLLSPAGGAGLTAQLKALSARSVTLLGGTGVLTQGAANAAAAATGVAPGRLAGADRHATARAVATHFEGATTYVMAGSNALVDAMSAAPIAGRLGMPVIFATPHCQRADQVAFLAGRGLTSKVVVGGGGAVSTVEANYTCGKWQAVPGGVTTCEPLWRAWNASLPASVRPWCAPSGRLGPVTAIGKTPSGQNLKWGWNGTKVGLTQRALGLGSRWETMDATTVNAVRNFQARRGLPVTGVVDRVTWDAMGTGYGFDIDAWRTNMWVAPTATRSQRIEAMIGYAHAQAGSEYTWGGAGPKQLGYDCSGLVLQALYAAGLDPRPIDVMKHQWPDYRTSRELAHHPGLTKVPWDQMRRGDLVFYQTDGVIDHVAIYLGNGRMFESGGNAMNAHETALRWGDRWTWVARPFV